MVKDKAKRRKLNEDLSEYYEAVNVNKPKRNAKKFDEQMTENTRCKLSSFKHDFVFQKSNKKNRKKIAKFVVDKIKEEKIKFKPSELTTTLAYMVGYNDAKGGNLLEDDKRPGNNGIVSNLL